MKAKKTKSIIRSHSALRRPLSMPKDLRLLIVTAASLDTPPLKTWQNYEILHSEQQTANCRVQMKLLPAREKIRFEKPLDVKQRLEARSTPMRLTPKLHYRSWAVLRLRRKLRSFPVETLKPIPGFVCCERSYRRRSWDGSPRRLLFSRLFSLWP